MLIYIYKNDSIFSCFRIIVSAGSRHQPVNLIVINIFIARTEIKYVIFVIVRKFSCSKLVFTTV